MLGSGYGAIFLGQIVWQTTKVILNDGNGFCHAPFHSSETKYEVL